MTEEQRKQADSIIRSFFAERKIKVTPFGDGEIRWNALRKEWIIDAEIVCRESDLVELQERLRAAGLR